MPKVLRIINRFNLGGPTYNAGYLTKYLPETYKTLLVGGQKDDSEASSEYILEKLDIKPVIISEMRRSINPLQDYKAYKQIKKIIQEFKPDIVHTHASKAGFAGRLAAFHCKVPVVVHTFHGHVFHSYFNKAITGIFKKTERYLAKKTTRIIAISEVQKKELTEIHKICSPDKTIVVPLGFDLQRFRDSVGEKRKTFRDTYNLDDNCIAIGIIGRIVPIKNHSLFIDAISHILKHSNKHIKAFIIGDGESRKEIEAYTKQLEIPFDTENSENFTAPIVFTSWIKDIDIATSGLDIITLTSYNEGTPVSLIEAQAANKPIVSTRVGGIEDIVLEGETALLSPLKNTDLFKNNLLELVNNDTLRKAMSNKASEFVTSKFSYQQLCSNIVNLYDSLLYKL